MTAVQINRGTYIKAKAALLKRRYYLFFKEFWPLISSEELIENWHHEYLCDELQLIGERVIRREAKLHDLVVNIPPGESKSSICVVLFPVWLWANDQTLKIISGSYESNLANAMNVKSADVIKSEKFRELFPEVVIRKDKDAKELIGLTAGGERHAVGSRGNMTGKHAHIILIDDPMNPKAAHSALERESVNAWLSGTVPTRKIEKRNTPTILIMQRLHDEDSTAEFLAKNDNVKHICLPARLSDNISPPELAANYKDGLLNPHRLDADVLAENEKLDNFEGQFMQSPVKPGGNILKPAWFVKYNLAELYKAAELAGETLIWNFCLDGAYTKNTMNAATVCIAWTKFRHKVYIRDVYRVWESITEVMDSLPPFLVANGYTRESMLFIEPKATGLDLIDILVQFKGINAIAAQTVKAGKVSADKIAAAMGITATLRAGMVLVPDGVPWLDAYFKELEAFPKGRYADQVDTTVLVVKESENVGFIDGYHN